MKPATRLIVEKLTSLASEGKNYQEAVEILGISYGRVASIVLRYDIPLRRFKKGRPHIPPGEREEKMRALHLEGKSFVEIGATFNLTGNQIGHLLRTCGVRAEDGGGALQARKKREGLNKKRAAYARRHFDLPYEEYRRLVKLPGRPTRKFAYHRRGASDRGIAFELTFAQWWKIWQQSGHWDQRGRGAHRYCMCRLGDVGPYAVDNVYIATCTENLQDGWLNRRTTSSPDHRGVA